MKCIYCGNADTGVIDSRLITEENAIRRRRECNKCKKRFTTYERAENIKLVVLKKDGTIEPYDKNKIKEGIIHSCVKRPITMEEIDKLLLEVEEEIYNISKTEISSEEIGEVVLNKLKKIDKVAYIRFASVYRDFTEVSSFGKEVDNIKEDD